MERDGGRGREGGTCIDGKGGRGRTRSRRKTGKVGGIKEEIKKEGDVKKGWKTTREGEGGKRR